MKSLNHEMCPDYMRTIAGIMTNDIDRCLLNVVTSKVYGKVNDDIYFSIYSAVRSSVVKNCITKIAAG